MLGHLQYSKLVKIERLVPRSLKQVGTIIHERSDQEKMYGDVGRVVVLRVR